jgi:pimeloyl-ACP methyl ester carboxylesterase
VRTRISYHREGEGPPLVLLHGIGHHWQAWRPVIELLRGEYEIFACDTPGFGRSAPLPPGTRPTIPAYVDAFEWFLLELGLDRPHVAGNSMGGAIALELARRRVAGSAIAFSPAGFWSPAERRFCQLSLMAVARTPGWLRPAIAALARTSVGRSLLFAQLYAHPERLPAEEALSALRDAWGSPAFAQTLRAFDLYDFAAPEKLRRTPVTIAWGARDRLLPPRRQAARARRMLPWASHVTIGTGHLPYSDDPAAVAAVIRAGARQTARADGAVVP